MLAPLVTTILIGFAGGLGAAARLGVYFVLDRGRSWPLWSILIYINLPGSFAIGYFSGVIARFESGAQAVGTGLILTGFLGGFTTFSSFAIETAEGIQASRFRGVALFLAMSLAGGVALAWLGQRLATWI